jgi:hypothetical protein
MSTTSNFQQVTNVGDAATTNTVQFTNPTTGFTVSSNAEVGGELSVSGNTAVSSNLTVSGNVGIGTTEPTESLDIVGNLNLQKVSNAASIKLNSNVVTEYVRSKKSLIKYPRVAMTQNALNNGYAAEASTENNGTSSGQAYRLFDGIAGGDRGYHSVGAIYTSGSTYNGSASITDAYGTQHQGEWIKLQMPTADKIKLSGFSFSPRYVSTAEYHHRAPYKGVFLGSTDGTNWYPIHYFDKFAVPELTTVSRTFENTTNDYYNRIALVAYEVGPNATYGDVLNFAEMELFGVPEYDPEAHGTDVIMRSVPNVPNTDWLEVYYDGQDYTSMPSTITDKSGNGVTGTPTNGVTFDSTWKAFNFDAATNQYITATTTNQAGAFVHTVSMWVKFSELTSSQHFLFRFGSTAGAAFTAIGMYYSANQGIRVSTGVDYRTRFHPTPGEWVHIMYSYSGGTLDEAASDTRVKFYVNGVRWQFQDYYQGGSVTPAALNLPGTNTLQVNGKDGASNIIVDMSVANFRLFNRALTGDEAWQLYAYQKDYFQVSPDVVIFKGGRLGIGTREPKAPLDVMGIPYGPGARPVFFATNDSSSGIMITSTGIFTDELPDAHINAGNCYDGTTGRFTPKIAGTYMFTFHLTVATDKNNRNFCQTTFYLNGTNNNRATTGRGLGYLAHQAVSHTDGELLPVHINRALYLNVGDYVQVGILQLSHAEVQVAQNYSWFTGYLLS